VLFCTETFAVGLNMPTKTVVFTDIFKFDNSGKRILHSHEFIQMSGRAGRRGIDKIGYVIITPQLFSNELSSSELQNLLFGGSQKIVSKFNIDHDWILNLIENNILDQVNAQTEKSLLNTELNKEKELNEKEIISFNEKIKNIRFDNIELYEEYEKLSEQLNGLIKPSNNQIKKIEQKMKDLRPKLLEYTKYQEYVKLKNELGNAINYKNELINYIDIEVKNQINILEYEGFIKDNKLTNKGQIARKIKELNSISTTNILVSDYLDSLFYNKKIHKILALFTLLCDGRDNDDYEILDEYYDVLKFIRSQGDILINRELLYPVLDWFDGKYSREIVEIYSIHEGDLIKSINKIIHLLDEVVQVFLLINKVEYIDVITEIKTRLMGEQGRNIVTMESLYLKIV
jgi:superfamily II RNA helicase